MQRLKLKRIGLALALFCALAVGYTARGVHLADARAAASEQTPTPPPAPPMSPPDFSSIVKRFGPAVVNVSITGTVKAGEQPTPFPFGQIDPNDPFYQFFKHFQVPQGEEMVHGLGSGFIVKSDGVILTNAHVVANASQVTVKLTDGREFKAKVIGVDKPTDIAVLKIDAKGLPTVDIGDSSNVQVGAWVLAIGSPFGFENSASAGIVSAKARSLPNESYVPFLQTDVPVNPGNSGGPLFDTSGKVIGVNSQIYTNSGGYQGLSFAIPIDVAMKVEGELAAHGKVTRGRLGVTIQDVNQELADSFGLKKPEGALVSQVEKGSPADKAGIEPGDVILKLDGHEVTHSSDLPPMVSDLAPGARAELQVWRKGATRSLDVVVGENAEGQVASADQGGQGHGRLGLAVRPLTPEERQQAGVGAGLLVEQVSGPAARAGIEPGDVVLSLNGTPVKNVDEMRGLLSHAGKHVALLVKRGEGRLFVPVDLG
ncbi:MAG TPA: DegQ family serine endoprotease [Anaeromyxobacteraceae bacterium]|nr:DegQ family serine endoprotease [Anaeromyxobacteraceae bacterium]